MKKKLAVLCMVLAAVLSLTGCMDSNIGIKMNWNGTISLAHEFYFTEESLSIKDMLIMYMEEEGYTVTEIEKDGQEGIKGERTIPADPTLPAEDEDVLYDPYQLIPTAFGYDCKVLPVKKLFSTTYVINQTIGLSSSQAGNPAINISITGPVQPVLSNATTSANFGRTQIWTIEMDKNNAIQYVVEVPNLVNLGIAMGILLLIGLLFVLVLVMRKKQNIVPEEEGILVPEEDAMTGEPSQEDFLEDAPLEAPAETDVPLEDVPLEDVPLEENTAKEPDSAEKEEE